MKALILKTTHMEKILFILLISLGAFAATASHPMQTDPLKSSVASDSISLDGLLAMDKKQFEGKTVAEFLASREAEGYKAISYRTHQEKELEAIRVKYSGNLYLHLYLVRSAALEQLKKNDDAEWDLEELKGELIEQIRVVYVMHEGKVE